MEGLIRNNDTVNRIAWGVPMLTLLIGVGLLLTIRKNKNGNKSHMIELNGCCR